MAALVVGYDGSPCAHRALDEAAALATRLGDEVVIVFGYDPGSIEAPEGASEHREVVRRFGERVTAEALERAASLGIDAEVELMPDRPVDALLDAGERHDARAIVVGSYGESPLKGAILGSTPHKLLHLSERPVLVVPSAPGDPNGG
jgi:nucleotide-binding universal stress UspA family protein